MNLAGNHGFMNKEEGLVFVFDLVCLLEVCSVVFMEMMLIGVLRLCLKRAATKAG